MRYSYDRRASTPVIIRPEGWNAANDEPDDWKRGGHLYRGMTAVEYEAHKRAGSIKSTGAYSHASEGTNFTDDAREAESYVNFGRDDPRKSGKPTYVIEVKNDPDLLKRWPDGYYKAQAPLPWKIVTRVWKCYAENGAVVAEQIK